MAINSKQPTNFSHVTAVKISSEISSEIILSIKIQQKSLDFYKTKTPPGKVCY